MWKKIKKGPSLSLSPYLFPPPSFSSALKSRLSKRARPTGGRGEVWIWKFPEKGERARTNHDPPMEKREESIFEFQCGGGGLSSIIEGSVLYYSSCSVDRAQRDLWEGNPFSVKRTLRVYILIFGDFLDLRSRKTTRLRNCSGSAYLRTVREHI